MEYNKNVDIKFNPDDVFLRHVPSKSKDWKSNSLKIFERKKSKVPTHES
jgi:hypothetical protein